MSASSLQPGHYGYAQGREQLLPARQSGQWQGSCVTPNVALDLSEGWTIQAVLHEETRLLLPPARHPACGFFRSRRTKAEKATQPRPSCFLCWALHDTCLSTEIFPPKIELRMVGCRPQNPTSPLNTMAVEAQPPPTREPASPSGFGQDTHTRIHTSEHAGLVLERQVKSRSILLFCFRRLPQPRQSFTSSRQLDAFGVSLFRIRR